MWHCTGQMLAPPMWSCLAGCTPVKQILGDSTSAFLFIPVPTSITCRKCSCLALDLPSMHPQSPEQIPMPHRHPDCPSNGPRHRCVPSVPNPWRDGGTEPSTTPVSSLAVPRLPAHTQLPINKHSSLNVSSPQPLGLNIGIGSAPGRGTSGFRLKQIVMNPICSVNMLSECFFR